MGFSDSRSWMFRGFPEVDPDTILRQSGNKDLPSEDEQERARWLWQRRPREMNVLAYGLWLGVGVMAHLPFLLLGSPQLFCVYHACYMIFVLWVGGVFFVKESRYRRWKKDYLRAVARFIRR